MMPGRPTRGRTTRKRKGEIELWVLGFCVFIAILAQVFFMLHAPDTYKNMLQRQVNDGEALAKASMLKAHLEEEYVSNALTDAAYQGMYARGRNGLGPWTEPPDWGTVQTRFEESVNTVLGDAYIGALTSGGGCTVEGGQGVTMAYDGETTASGDSGQDVTTFTVNNENPLFVQCDAVSLLGQSQSTRVKELVAVPGQREVPRMRYQAMHGVAREIMTDATFQDLLETAKFSATTAVIHDCRDHPGTGSGCAQWNPPEPRSDVPEELANKEEAMAGEELETRLQNRFGGSAGDDFTVTVTVRELEFTPQNVQQISDSTKSWRDGACSVSQPPSTWTIRNWGSCGSDCDICEIPSGATCNSESRPEICGASCTDPSYCPSVADKDAFAPPRPSSTGSYWTEDVWDAPCGLSHEDPYQYTQSSRVAYDPAPGPAHNETRGVMRSATLRPLRELSHGQDPGPAPGGPDPTVCQATCESQENSCDKYFTYSTRTQTALTFDLESRTVVEVTINDTRNEIPTDRGFVQPVYTFTYETTFTQPRR